jgi:hypothetical protein
MRKISDVMILSNLAFLVPLLLTISKTLYLYASFIVAVFIFSCLFHLYKEKKFKFLDGLFAWLLILVNLYTFYTRGLFHPNFWAALVFVAIGFYFKSKNHSIWHVASAIITMLAIV